MPMPMPALSRSYISLTTVPPGVPMSATPLWKQLVQVFRRDGFSKLASTLQAGLQLSQPEANRLASTLSRICRHALLGDVLAQKRNLRRGLHWDATVGIVQDCLRAWGFAIDDDSGRNRGYFGPQTEIAVRAFQKSRGLRDDGIVGKQTLLALLGNKALGFPIPETPSEPQMRELDAAGLQLIRSFEGYREQIYWDSAGLATIGYGHLITASERHRFGQGITPTEAEALLAQDVAVAVRTVNDSVRVPIHQNQFNALVSFTFNVGTEAFRQSTLLRELNAGQYDRVGPELQRWVHAGGERIVGLVRRRTEEAALFQRPSE